MREQLLPGLRLTLFMTLVLGVVYPLAVTGVSQAIFPKQANGSLIRSGSRVIGSELIGQAFTRAEYFHPRPSSAGSGYDAAASGGSNLGPTSAKLLHGATRTDAKGNPAVDFDGIGVRLVHYCVENGIPYESSAPLAQFQDAGGGLDDLKLVQAFRDPASPLVFRAKTPVPADAVTGSASGLDPHISPANAEIQAARVARARAASEEQVRSLVRQWTENRTWGFLGEPRVNVLQLNLALDRQFPVRH